MCFYLIIYMLFIGQIGAVVLFLAHSHFLGLDRTAAAQLSRHTISENDVFGPHACRSCFRAPQFSQTKHRETAELGISDHMLQEPEHNQPTLKYVLDLCRDFCWDRK